MCSGRGFKFDAVERPGAFELGADVHAVSRGRGGIRTGRDEATVRARARMRYSVSRSSIVDHVTVVGFFFVTAGFSGSSYVTQVGVAPDQPVPFSHKHHAGELGVDCRYCHQHGREARNSPGMPPTWTCMTCHSQIWKDSPMLEPVRASLEKNEAARLDAGEPAAGLRLFQPLDPHHQGHRVLELPRQSSRRCSSPSKVQTRSKWSFCLNCHRNPEKFVRPQTEIFDMAWTPPARPRATLGPALVKSYHIGQPEKLSDCSICHR